jgi:hypothetical protein
MRTNLDAHSMFGRIVARTSSMSHNHNHDDCNHESHRSFHPLKVPEPNLLAAIAMITIMTTTRLALVLKATFSNILIGQMWSLSMLPNLGQR